MIEFTKDLRFRCWITLIIKTNEQFYSTSVVSKETNKIETVYTTLRINARYLYLHVCKRNNDLLT